MNHRLVLISGLWDRLARYARGTVSQRMFIIGELTHVLSCDISAESGSRDRTYEGGK